MRPSLLIARLPRALSQRPIATRRWISTLPNNPHIYVHETPQSSPKRYILSYLRTSPPNESLAVGSTTQIPPSPESFHANDVFLDLVHAVIAEHAVHDPDVQAQAATYASQAGSALGSGGVFFAQQHGGSSARQNRRVGNPSAQGGDGAGGASSQGGMGGAGRGGYIHVSDQRNPPDFGRVAWPEDIFGSLELDGNGRFVDGNGRYQRAGTYRMVTREGILGLSKHLQEKLVERLQELEEQTNANRSI